MNWLKIPKSICKRIDKTNKYFLWNKNKEEKAKMQVSQPSLEIRYVNQNVKKVRVFKKTRMLMQLSLQNMEENSNTSEQFG